MFISAELKTSNIAEYILYMWQIEDVVRACELDINLVEKHILAPQKLDKEKHAELTKWYTDICNKMKLQKIKLSGHLRTVNETLVEATLLSDTLITHYKDEEYAELFERAEFFIPDFRLVANNPNVSNLEIFFTGLYGKLILKLKGQKISEETEEAFEAFRKVLALLSVRFNQMKAGTLEEAVK